MQTSTANNIIPIDLGEPNEKQKLFLLDRHKYIGYGGAKGGGKSWGIRTKATLGAYTYPGIRICIIRRSFPELLENHIDPLTKLLQCYNENKKKRLARYVDNKKRIIFPNGSKIIFRYCENKRDVSRFQGAEYDWMFIDEATHFEEDVFKELASFVRGANNIPKRVYITCNPGGIGHQWVKRLFIDRAFERNEKPDEYNFIQAKVRDNKVLMEMNPDYVSNLEALPPNLRAAFLDGDWNIFTGQYFEEWRNHPENEDKRWTHVIKPFTVPYGWKIYRSFDWGYNKPFSCGWWALDYDGVLYRIREWYGCTEIPNTGVELVPDKVFKEIYRIEHEDPNLIGREIIGVADPAIWNKNTGYSIYDSAIRNGISFRKGDNERVAGWLQCHYRLAFDENGYPMVYIFDTCKDFIRTIPLMMVDDHRPEDLDSDLEDHAMDEFRYMCMLRTIKPRQNIKPVPKADDPLDVLKKEIN